MHGLGNRKNELLLEKIRKDGVEAYDGLAALRARRYAPRGLRTAVVSSSANCRDVLARGRHRGPVRRADRRGGGRRARAARQAAPRTPSWPRPTRPRRRARREPPSSRTRWPAWTPGRAGRFGYVVGVDRVGQADALRAHGADIVVQDLAELLEDRSTRDHRIPSYAVEPWALRESELNLDVLPQSESVFALSNGHVGWRGNLDEGEPHGLPGSYLNGVHELHPLPYAEAGYGYPESGQTVINVTNGKIIRLLVDDEPFDLRYGRLRSHERVLDLRTGVLHRTCEWTSPAGCTVRVRSTRLVSFTQRAIAAVAYEVEAVDAEVRVVVQSELVANEQLPDARRGPAGRRRAGVAAGAGGELRRRACGCGWCTARGAAACGSPRPPTTSSAAPIDHAPRSESGDDVARLTVTSVLEPGERLRLEKLVAYGWSGARSLPAVRDQVDAALAGAPQHAAGRAWCDQQRAYLDDFWARADVEVDGDAEIQQAVRFALFHVLQAGARAEQRAIPAKGLTGSGYDGHSFWDTETFVLPLLTYTSPECRRRGAALAARHAARRPGAGRANSACAAPRSPGGPSTARSAPRTGRPAPPPSTSTPTSPTRWCATSAATGDEEFERETAASNCWSRPPGCGARWATTTTTGAFHIDGVTGPDEYSAVADDNVYTNLMAQANLRAAADVVERHPEEARRARRRRRGGAAWRDAAEAMRMPVQRRPRRPRAVGRLHRPPACGTSPGTGPDQYPLMLHFPYFDLYRKQVVKQADLVLAMYLRGDVLRPTSRRPATSPTTSR